LPTANGRAIVTLRRGSSLPARPSSPAAEPIRNSPGGTTTISGHSWHSLNWSLGFSSRSSVGDNGRPGRDAGRLDAPVFSGDSDPVFCSGGSGRLPVCSGADLESAACCAFSSAMRARASSA
jgi:hypothetical protein